MKYEAAREHVAKIRKFELMYWFLHLYFYFSTEKNIFHLNEFNLDWESFYYFLDLGNHLSSESRETFCFDYDWERKMIEKNL